MIRKDSYVKAGVIVGLVAKMNKKAGEVHVVDSDGKLQVVSTSVPMTKLSKAEYDREVTELKSVQVENSVKANRAPSKQVLAFDTFIEYHKAHPGTRRANRAPILKMFQEQVGLTERGAETYYYNANKVYGDQLAEIHGE